MRQTAGYSVAIEGITEQVTTDQRFTEQGLPASRGGDLLRRAGAGTGRHDGSGADIALCDQDRSAWTGRPASSRFVERQVKPSPPG